MCFKITYFIHTAHSYSTYIFHLFLIPTFITLYLYFFFIAREEQNSQPLITCSRVRSCNFGLYFIVYRSQVKMRRRNNIWHSLNFKNPADLIKLARAKRYFRLHDRFRRTWNLFLHHSHAVSLNLLEISISFSFRDLQRSALSVYDFRGVHFFRCTNDPLRIFAPVASRRNKTSRNYRTHTCRVM